MIPTIIKTLTFLIINLQFLNESQAAQKSPPKVPSPSPLVPPQEKPDNYTPQYTQFLQACEKIMTEQCADEIVENIFGKGGKVSKNCCSKLVYMGPDCHVAFVEGEKNLIKEYAKDKKKVLSRSQNLYKTCEKSVPPIKDKNYPRFPPREFRPDYEEFLEACAEKLTDKCGTEVVYAIFKKNKKVDKSCCKKLLKMGRECHDELIKGLRNLGEYAKDEKEVKAKSDHVWKHCQDITGDK